MSSSRNRKSTPLSQFGYKFVERFLYQTITLLVGIVLARLLSPIDYGNLAVLSIIVAFVQVFVQGGLSTSLLQKKDIQDVDYDTAFVLVILSSLIAYLLIFTLAPYIEILLDSSNLTIKLRVLSLGLFPSSLVSIQIAVLTRERNQRANMFASAITSVASGAVGITLAYKNFGSWALIAQQLFQQTAVTVVLFYVLDWKPKFRFSKLSAKSLYKFGWKILAYNVINAAYLQIRGLVIGVRYNVSQLAHYQKADNLGRTPILMVDSTIQSILLPICADVQNNLGFVKAYVRKSISVSSYLVAPMLIGLIVVSEPLIEVVYTSKWLTSAEYLRAMCIMFLTYPINSSKVQGINSIGRSDITMKVEIINKVQGFMILLFTVLFMHNVQAIVWGATASALLVTITYFVVSKKLLDYPYVQQFKDFAPSLSISAIMGIIVYIAGRLTEDAVLKLAIQVITGAVTYFLFSKIVHNESFNYLKGKMAYVVTKAKRD